ncbi:amino acid transporter [Papiliotrema laurentii]|uniref:Amino acid transporter n=1 Tax=Papiliotrema laurentii TaxID=5418 RepID=A0AAD9CWM4_PAPLA|nr:amino acid transporter [Papiliotrema laurentii]
MDEAEKIAPASTPKELDGPLVRVLNDEEEGPAVVTVQRPDSGLKRELKARHMAMISIGGVLGTGLFLYTGDALANGGPLGLLLGFAVMGSVCYSVMISLGEMVALIPLAGGPIALAERFVDPSWSWALGWLYWYTWAIFLPSELSAIAVLINLWNTSINNALWISLFLLAAVTINLLGPRAYGESEFILATIKIITITGLILLGIILAAGGGPNKQATGFKYWRDPGPFVQYLGIPGALGRFLGFWAVLTQAAFAYIGSEIVAIAAGEAKNPRKSIPIAIRNVYIRIILFYFGGTFVIGLLVASNDERLALNAGTALASPFVIAIENAGIKVLPSIINAALLLSGLSGAGSELFTSSRALHGLATIGSAPKVFARTSTRGVPVYAILFNAVIACLAYMSLGSTAGEAFGYFVNLGSAGGLLMWWGMCFTFVRFEAGLRAQGVARSTLPYSNRLNKGAGAAKWALGWISIVLFFSGWSNFYTDSWSTGSFLTTYLPIIIFPCLYFGHKLVRKTRMISPGAMEFEVDERGIEVEEEAQGTRAWSKIWTRVKKSGV